MGGSKSRSSQTSRSDNTSVSIGVGGDNNGFLVNGSGNTFNAVDHGAVDASFGLVRDAMTGQTHMFESALAGNESVSLAAMDNVLLANDEANYLSGLAIESNAGIVDQVLLGNTDTQLAVAGLASEFGDDLTYLADGSIQGNQALTELSINNNALLTSDFGDKMLAMSDSNQQLALASMDNSAALSSQFGADMSAAYSGYSNNLADITTTSINRNAELSNEFGNKMVDVVSDSQMALTEMAVLQERGLENALEVAGNMSMDDSAESSAEMIKYISIGLAVVGAAMVFKNG
ncbi:hypothetical protein [Thalassotalea castellviae]|uniref:Chemotaxis protein n=1 Tax=Thalassotalea castellviae TaxID=3075612 RepID=A0ABU2ZZY5_9GAMM|nr:hypothetical protein [Thalassotalea sp. W431]MDT0603488.1 hypothetical protein [Thalassotalea sp. W431]